jgi:hypothetical protein
LRNWRCFEVNVMVVMVSVEVEGQSFGSRFLHKE